MTQDLEPPDPNARPLSMGELLSHVQEATYALQIVIDGGELNGEASRLHRLAGSLETAFTLRANVNKYAAAVKDARTMASTFTGRDIYTGQELTTAVRECTTQLRRSDLSPDQATRLRASLQYLI